MKNHFFKEQSGMSKDIVEKVRKAAILNAVRHDGKADAKAVLGNLLGDNPELRSRARELVNVVEQVVEEVNSTPAERLMEIVNERWREELTKERMEEKRELPPLPNAQKYRVIVTRIAPNPDFVLHIGNARAAILSHDYARMYKGKFIVRFEDTDPRLKKAQLRYYDMIREDLRWLGCEWDDEFIQSDRISYYYEVGSSLVAKAAAYICECDPEQFRKFISARKACPDRDLAPQENSKRWERMLDGGYDEGSAVFRVKTDLSHPNPAVRDWPAFRVIDTTKNPHPRVGSTFRVWPLYNMASGVDDHALDITHVIRGKEHLTNMQRQFYMYKHMGWIYPEAVHYGRLKVEGMNLSKSKLMKALETGEYKGVDDPRLGTLAALRRRGFNPDTIRRLMWDIGPKPVEVTISWDNVNALNRKIIDPTSHRYYFVADPVLTKVAGVPREYVVRVPLHPQHPEMGNRTLRVSAVDGYATVYVSKSDKSLLSSEKAVRLMGLFNFRPVSVSDAEVSGEFLGEVVSDAEKMPIMQWVPSDENVHVELVMPDATIKKGVGEIGLRAEPVGSVIQFVRFGFGRIDSVAPDEVTVYFAHQ